MIRFDPAAREIALGVRDLIYFDAIAPLRPEPLAPIRARAGAREHLRHRREAEVIGREDYRAERAIDYRTERRGYRIAISGRIDGVYRDSGRWVVEEVKTVILDPYRFAPGELERAVLEEGAYSAYRSQLELYVFFLSASLEEDLPAGGAPQPPPSVAGRLVLRNLAGSAAARDIQDVLGAEPLRPDGRLAVEWTPDLAAVKAWVEARLDALIDRVEAEETARAARRSSGDRLAFPFPRLRPHQAEIMDLAGAALASGEHLLLSAPTGIGKTAAVLFAALRHALQNGLRIFYATAKTSQRRLVAETLERIAAASAAGGGPAPFRAVILRAREKMCPNLEEAGFIHCHEDVCPYARDYAAKVDAGRSVARLLELPVALPEAAREIGQAAGACPFELSLDAALEADVVVGDYNHVFDPESQLRRYFQERRPRDHVLIIDEAHNLYSRGRDAYSPELSRREVTALADWAKSSGPLFATAARQALTRWCRRLDNLFAELSAYGRDELGDPALYQVEIEPAILSELDEELEAIRTALMVEERLFSRGPAPAGPPEDPLVAFAARWGRFVAAREVLEGGPARLLYDKSGDKSGASHRLRLLCLDPAVPLGRRLSQFRSAIAFSATLEPLAFYRDVLGFPADRTRLASLPSPFPPENRKVLVWGGVSTYFRSRSRDASEVARLIEEITAVERGNYLVSFSSYRYLREVAQRLSPGFLEGCLVQTPGMAEGERDRTLEALREPGSARTLLAVQGGVFTEGVDYPSSMLIGVVVVGPGLPAFTPEEELVRAHFEDRYHEGFEYTYLYPGMNRVIQSAGRLIRSETDVGVIVLLGERFAQSQYMRLFPADWYRSSPRELIANDLLSEIREFWGSRPRAGSP